jgi:hypothetical protein
LDFPKPIVNPDGSLCIFWEQDANTLGCDYESTEASIRMRRSDNPTTTPVTSVLFNPEVTVARTSANWTSWWGGNADRRASLGLGVAVDTGFQRSPLALYCVLNGARPWVKDVAATEVDITEEEPNDDTDFDWETIKHLKIHTFGLATRNESGLGEIAGGGDVVDYWAIDAEVLLRGCSFAWNQ